MAQALALNPEQRHAVEHGEGPLLVIAGPGSGKTRVITHRIVWLLENVSGLRPDNMLALTFTDKAAGEMKQRVAEALPGLEKAPHISTFHSFCYEVLRKRHFQRRLLDKVDLWIFLRRRMEHLELELYRKLAEPGAFLHALNDFFSRCQDELIEPPDFQAYVERIEQDFLARSSTLNPAERKLGQEELEKKKELARVFHRSQKLLEEASCSSLGSLIPETVRLFDRERDLLREYQERFQYVLVDEFQDTNFAQVELLRRLVAPPHNITAVGDDDQAIYRFRGAAHGAFQMFAQTFPGYRTLYLHRNYRSTKRILHAASAVIARNERSDMKKPHLTTDKPEGSLIYLLQSLDYSSEAVWIAERIEALGRNGTRLGDIAILYRAHAYRNPLVAEFRRRRIPFAIRGLSILSTVIVRDLLAYLNLIHSPHDNVSLTRALLAPRWRFPEKLSLELRRQALRDRCSLYDVIEARCQSCQDSDLDNTGWVELRQLLERLRGAAHRMPVTAVFDHLTDELELVFLPDDHDQVYLRAFRAFLEKWEKEKGETSKLAEFMEYFQYFRDAGGQIEAPELDDSSNAVQMMTVHAAKGLEFAVVFIISVAPRRFPHSEQKPVIEFPDELRKGPRPPADIHLQEERRLFFVAMTRAQECLYVSSVAKAGKKPSKFIDDLLSPPAIRAHDIEIIEVPAMLPAEPVPTRVLLSEAAPPRAQPSLFARASKPPSVYPDLTGWSAQPVSIDRDGKLPLSATAIEDYGTCPLKFKLGHYLKVPTGPQGALTFGNIMHQCVRHYFELRRQELPRFEQIAAFYLESWKGAGFEDEYQEQTYRRAGLEQLRAFVERHNALAVDAKSLQMEAGFEVDLGDVVLEGRIDQITPLGGNSVELVDYKTGRPRSQKDADESLQLSVYALAATRRLRLNPVRLTFYNLTTNEPVSSVRTAAELEHVQAEIGEVATQIRQQFFPPRPGSACKYCEFVPICPAHEEIF